MIEKICKKREELCNCAEKMIKDNLKKTHTRTRTIASIYQ